ncbi:MAG: hypothetical protein HY062_13645 [Bacteroidetes bacterium]|nr:hypothetical protein [Bacteroidota bacterium]
MKIKYLIRVILLTVVIMVTSCKKKENTQPINSSSSGAFTLALSSDKTSINVGSQAVITATASGASGNVTYTWSVNTSSSITGSGYKVNLYASCPSCTGPNQVTCTAKDANNNSVVTKITITVN